jgi:hypothetical protein
MHKFQGFMEHSLTVSLFDMGLTECLAKQCWPIYVVLVVDI